MKKALLEAIEFYAEAAPAAVLADQGVRAQSVQEQLCNTPEDRQDDPDEPDRLTALLEAVNVVVESFNGAQSENQDIANLQRCAQEWTD